MTTAENEIDLQQNDPMAATQSLPFSLPPYPKMIMDAIEASNDPNGCNKTAIAKHIESAQNQITLPPSHNTLLNYHLNHMKQTGQLVIVKNNYMKPNPNGPPKRGRGRPPKPKPDVDPSHAAAVPAPSASPPRPRGRPPKSKDSQPEPKAKAAPSGSVRPRGRPPKKQKTGSETVKVDAPTAAQPEGERRGRGRPPKVKPAMVPVGC